MKRIRASATLGLAVLAGLASPFAAAAEDAGWYIGANVGQSRAKIDDEKITRGLLGAGFTQTTIANDERDLGYKLFGGYEFNRNFALEGGYFDLGKFGYKATTVPAGTFTGDLRGRGINLDAVGMLPFTDKFSGFARLGVIYAQAKDTFSGNGAVVVTDTDAKKNAANYKFGLGLQYDFTRALGGRIEAERFRLNDAVGNKGDIDLFSLGVVYRFGRNKAVEEKTASVAEEPRKEEEEVAPLVVVVPVEKKNSQYCSILDLTFDINNDEIQPDDKERLGVIGTYMKKYPDTTAVIEGHSDDVGTADYNMNLSQHRADSVVSYLTSTYKITPSRLSAVGYGNTRPVADNHTSEGRHANRRINAVIACVTDVSGLTVIPARTTMAMELEFDPYKADIKPEYRDELAKVAKFMKANPTVTATVEGHAGKQVGNTQVTAEASMEVSRKRAESVVNYLADLGVPRSHLTAAAYGQTRRVAYSTTLEGQQENRRVNIIFNYGK
ncbi:MAG: OmpA family protein [bacterium]|nr:OmpA family protein [bacterium]